MKPQVTGHTAQPLWGNTGEAAMPLNRGIRSADRECPRCNHAADFDNSAWAFRNFDATHGAGPVVAAGEAVGLQAGSHAGQKGAFLKVTVTLSPGIYQSAMTEFTRRKLAKTGDA